MITVCGNKVTHEELNAIEPVTPEGAGRRWKPVYHGELVDTIKDEVYTRGWGIEQELYSTGSDGADMAGALLLSKVGGVAVPGGMSLSLGFLNSNRRRRALQITVGASVLCCCNGMCTRNIILSRMHDHTVDIITEVEVAMDAYVNAALGIPAVVEGLRSYELLPGEASEILMEAGRRRIVGWAAIGRVDQEYRNPTFAEHGRGTSWALLNAFTYAARKNINPMEQMRAYDVFRGMLPTGARG